MFLCFSFISFLFLKIDFDRRDNRDRDFGRRDDRDREGFTGFGGRGLCLFDFLKRNHYVCLFIHSCLFLSFFENIRRKKR